jgi:hypothetical protein
MLVNSVFEISNNFAPIKQVMIDFQTQKTKHYGTKA